MELPLKGIVVADFSRILAGPLCTEMLADAGARVIKIEEVGRGDETRRWGPPFLGDESSYFLSINRNKESVTLDLKSGAGLAIAKKLIAIADVVIHNFKDEQAKKFGLTAAAVRRVNKRAVLCGIRGWERDSPEEALPGYDLLAQAAGGLMAITGDREGMPTKVGVALSDVLTAHYAHGAILSALVARERSGKASAVEISIVGATAASLVNVAQNFLLTQKEPNRYGNEHPSIVPYQAFMAADRAFVIAVATDRHFESFCRDVLRDEALAADPRFTTNALRVANRSLLVPKLEADLREKKADVWVKRCRALGIPAAKVQNYAELFSSSAAPLLQSVRHPSIGDLQVVGNPVLRDGKRARVRTAPPLLGQHTARVLKELGYSKEEIVRLRRGGSC